MKKLKFSFKKLPYVLVGYYGSILFPNVNLDPYIFHRTLAKNESQEEVSYLFGVGGF